MFIELINEYDKKVWINKNKIIFFEKQRDGLVYVEVSDCLNSNGLYVKNTVEEILKKLNG